ncbi:MAG: glycosyltransferase [Thermoplasmata archaeon]|nr:glycosyltransferase [Thermoplasmata archaeon]
MGSSPDSPAFVSIVITVRNEARHVGRLLESLLVQEPPFEIVLVDAFSRDGTWELVEAFGKSHPDLLRAVQKSGSRGIGRNVGVAKARGAAVAFIDGDCVADSGWLQKMREGLAQHEVIAGQTVPLGQPQYGRLERVELFRKESDVTYPSCNLAYRRDLFLRLNGFDPRFITAEDIDLNLRAVDAGATIQYEPGATVYHAMRSTFVRFLYQAFWNGYGRKQLTEKHGRLWGDYRLRRLISNQRSVIAWVRIVAALAGYGSRVATGAGERLDRPAPTTPELREAAASAPTGAA